MFSVGPATRTLLSSRPGSPARQNNSLFEVSSAPRYSLANGSQPAPVALCLSAPGVRPRRGPGAAGGFRSLGPSASVGTQT